MFEGPTVVTTADSEKTSPDKVRFDYVVPVGAKVRSGAISDTFRLARKRDGVAIMELRKKH